MSNWEVLLFIGFIYALYRLYIADWAPGKEESDAASFHERDGGLRGDD